MSSESSFDESKKLCPLQLVCGRKRWFLRARASKYCESDERPKVEEPSVIHSEASFIDLDQSVERSYPDLFSNLNNSSKNFDDIHFTGKLKKFNMPFRTH